MNVEDYYNGRATGITKEQESDFLNCKNTGSRSEKYVENCLVKNDIKYQKNKRITVDSSYIIPDFYLPEYDLIIEVKSRGYNSPGTSSEKIDNIPRKYSRLLDIDIFKNTKVIVVFCAYEITNKHNIEIIECSTKYTRDFVELCKKYNTVAWIPVYDMLSVIKSHPSVQIIQTVKPVIKWAGGKSKISKNITQLFPKEYSEYYEPFVGGGAIGLGLQAATIKHFSDINHRLITMYNTLKTKPQELIQELKNERYSNNRESFLKVRKEFNTIQDETIASASFIYLNKCCFNGLYRENSRGGFNVPFGDMKNPKICDEELLIQVSNFLQNIEVSCKSFLDITPKLGDLVYFDPPYHETFSGYNQAGFTEQDHEKLKDFIDALTERKVKIVMSNSNTEFITNLYKDYSIKIINTRYSVGKNRTKVEEVVITNF